MLSWHGYSIIARDPEFVEGDEIILNTFHWGWEGPPHTTSIAPIGVVLKMEKK